jgi:hypothetical protein
MTGYGVGERGSWEMTADMSDDGAKPGDAILDAIGGLRLLSTAGMEVSVRGRDFIGIKVGAGGRFGGKRVSFICIKEAPFGTANSGYQVNIADRAGKNLRTSYGLQADELRGFIERSTGLKLAA